METGHKHPLILLARAVFAPPCAAARAAAQVLPKCRSYCVRHPQSVSWGMDRQHHYRIVNRWTGNLGTGTSAYAAYSRDHELSSAGKASPIPGSSDPMFRGDRTRYNPEELLLGALSACHMLWVLHYSADAGITIVEYEDDAWGEMAEHADGSGEFTRVVLRPRVRILEPERVDDAIAIHARAHAVCAMARSVKFPVEHQPAVAT